MREERELLTHMLGGMDGWIGMSVPFQIYSDRSNRTRLIRRRSPTETDFRTT